MISSYIFYKIQIFDFLKENWFECVRIQNVKILIWNHLSFVNEKCDEREKRGVHIFKIEFFLLKFSGKPLLNLSSFSCSQNTGKQLTEGKQCETIFRIQRE